MTKNDFTAAEFYALICAGDKSLLKMNKVLTAYKMKIITVPLDEFERAWRPFFGLCSFDPVLTSQRVEVCTDDQSAPVFISEELSDTLRKDYLYGPGVLKKGYLCCLKKVKNWPALPKNAVPAILIQEELRRLSEFCVQLRKILSLTGHHPFRIGGVFAFDLNEGNVTMLEKKNAAGMEENFEAYEEKDNYWLKMLLNSEH